MTSERFDAMLPPHLDNALLLQAGRLLPASDPEIGEDPAPLLLVDDESRNLDALEATLEATGCALVRARSAEEALLA
ncbi:MAG: hypothetical protein ACT4P7_17970, partial [Gemmatimonadaceae bacterium]